MSIYKTNFPSVLLIENDLHLKEFFGRMISNCGYEVLHLNTINDIPELADSEAQHIHATIVNELESPEIFFNSYLEKFQSLKLGKPPVILLTSGDDDLKPEIVNKTFHIARKINFNMSELSDKLSEAITV